MRRAFLLVIGIAASWLSPMAAQQARMLSLAEALELAEGASENVGIARAAVERARGERQQARSDYFPQLTGSATYTRTLESQFDIA